jgi:hypothetical protein
MISAFCHPQQGCQAGVYGNQKVQIVPSSRTRLPLSGPLAGSWPIARRLIVDPRTQDLAGIVASIRADGASSFHAVADELNRQGITTARGSRWHAATVQRLEVREKSANLG